MPGSEKRNDFAVVNLNANMSINVKGVQVNLGANTYCIVAAPYLDLLRSYIHRGAINHLSVFNGIDRASTVCVCQVQKSLALFSVIFSG